MSCRGRPTPTPHRPPLQPRARRQAAVLPSLCCARPGRRRHRCHRRRHPSPATRRRRRRRRRRGWGLHAQDRERRRRRVASGRWHRAWRGRHNSRVRDAEPARLPRCVMQNQHTKRRKITRRNTLTGRLQRHAKDRWEPRTSICQMKTGSVSPASAPCTPPGSASPTKIASASTAPPCRATIDRFIRTFAPLPPPGG